MSVEVKKHTDSTFLVKTSKDQEFTAKPRVYEIIVRANDNDVKKSNVICKNLETGDILFMESLDKIKVNGSIFETPEALTSELSPLVFNLGGGSGSGASNSNNSESECDYKCFYKFVQEKTAFIKNFLDRHSSHYVLYINMSSVQNRDFPISIYHNGVKFKSPMDSNEDTIYLQDENDFGVLKSTDYKGHILFLMGDYPETKSYLLDGNKEEEIKVKVGGYRVFEIENQNIRKRNIVVNYNQTSYEQYNEDDKSLNNIGEFKQVVDLNNGLYQNILPNQENEFIFYGDSNTALINIDVFFTGVLKIKDNLGRVILEENFETPSQRGGAPKSFQLNIPEDVDVMNVELEKSGVNIEIHEGQNSITPIKYKYNGVPKESETGFIPVMVGESIVLDKDDYTSGYFYLNIETQESFGNNLTIPPSDYNYTQNDHNVKNITFLGFDSNNDFDEGVVHNIILEGIIAPIEYRKSNSSQNSIMDEYYEIELMKGEYIDLISSGDELEYTSNRGSFGGPENKVLRLTFEDFKEIGHTLSFTPVYPEAPKKRLMITAEGFKIKYIVHNTVTGTNVKEDFFNDRLGLELGFGEMLAFTSDSVLDVEGGVLLQDSENPDYRFGIASDGSEYSMTLDYETLAPLTRLNFLELAI